MTQEALKLALEALKAAQELAGKHDAELEYGFQQAIAVIKEALAQPEQWGASVVTHPEYVAEQKRKTEELRSMLTQPEQEPVADALHFAQWTAAKKDLSDYICIGELTLAGIEDNLEGLEFGESEIERFEAVIESLQENLVTGRECKKVPLIAYIGENNITPPQRTREGCGNVQKINLGTYPTKEEASIAYVAAKLFNEKKHWVGLTDEEHNKLAVDWGCLSADWILYAAAVERAVKEKNI
jgi:hypothetical protein